MADVNINFGTDDSLDKLKKDLADILKLVKNIKKADIIGDDEALKAKKLTAEMLKVENAIKKQEGASKRLADQQQKRTDKLKQEKGIIGGLEKEVKDLTKAWKSAGTAIDKATAKNKLDKVRKQLTGAKNTTASWGKALGSFQFKFNALGNIAANALGKITRGAKEFLKDAIKMSLELEGVENAFNKLNDPNLLSNLQKATRGTVNNLELMKTAVLAKNFRIPLEQLETFLQFAGDRALQTGEDFEFLVQSIVKGLGRKSVLILDNLGLSVIEINAEVKKTGDFMTAAANIIEREMTAAGEVVDTQLVKVKQLKADWENVKLEVGTGASNAIANFGESFNFIANNTIIDFINMRKEARRLAKDIDDIVPDGPIVFDEATITVNIKNLKRLREELKFKKQVVEETNIADTQSLLITKQEIKALEDQIREIEELGSADEKLHEAWKARRKERLTISKSLDEAEKKSTKEGIDSIDDFIDKLDEEFDEIERLEELRTKNAEEGAGKRKKIGEDELTFRQKILSESFKAAANLSNSLAKLIQKNKEVELSAAGDNAEKRLEIEQEFSKKQQAISISQAIINGAQAVTEVWKKWAGNPGIAAAFTALAVGTVGAQIAVIKSQKFAKGGKVDGPLHAQGGVNAELEGGEYVINRASTSKYKNLIEGINENDQLKIMMAMDKDRMLPSVKEDPTLKKILKAIENQPVYGESPTYYIEHKGPQTIKLKK